MRRTIIASHPPNDGNEWECQCARCGSSMTFIDCSVCGGEGYTAPGELYEMDPLWYDEDDTEPCHQCGGTGGGWLCLADDEGRDGESDNWCRANPRPERETIEPSTVEWFLARSVSAGKRGSK